MANEVQMLFLGGSENGTALNRHSAMEAGVEAGNAGRGLCNKPSKRVSCCTTDPHNYTKSFAAHCTCAPDVVLPLRVLNLYEFRGETGMHEE